jgi:DNA polymerase III delta prime subunit
MASRALLSLLNFAICRVSNKLFFTCNRRGQIQIIISGPPGSGKTSVASYLRRFLGRMHISGLEYNYEYSEVSLDLESILAAINSWPHSCPRDLCLVLLLGDILDVNVRTKILNLAEELISTSQSTGNIDFATLILISLSFTTQATLN